MILVISYPEEDHTVDVVERLKSAGREVTIMDLSEFPAKTTIELSWSAKEVSMYVAKGRAETVDLSSVHVAWWRRVTPFSVDPAVRDPSLRAFAESETSQAVNGALDMLYCAWVNPRCADDSAHRKPCQWVAAKRVGLALPRTLVTNNPDTAHRFIQDVGVGSTVFKAFLAIQEAWRETRLVQNEDLSRLDLVRYAPVIFQEYIDGTDLRITVIGNKIFAAEIDARRTSYPFDMRMAISEAAFRPVELPSQMHGAILKLLRELGLIYGAIDMRRTPEGKYFFLEVNPAGQWLFVEQRTGMPISQAMADLLAELDDNPLAAR